MPCHVDTIRGHHACSIVTKALTLPAKVPSPSDAIGSDVGDVLEGSQPDGCHWLTGVGPAMILVNSFATLSGSEDYEAGVTPAEWERAVGYIEHV